MKAINGKAKEYWNNQMGCDDWGNLGEAHKREVVRQFMSENGKKGGKAIGNSKSRGSKAYYRKLSKLAHEKKSQGVKP